MLPRNNSLPHQRLYARGDRPHFRGNRFPRKFFLGNFQLAHHSSGISIKELIHSKKQPCGDRMDEETLKQMPAWYVALREAYLKQADEDEKKKRASNKLFQASISH